MLTPALVPFAVHMGYWLASCVVETPLQVLPRLTPAKNTPWIKKYVCLHTQVTLVVLLAMLTCALASHAPKPNSRKLAATINIIAAPDTRDGNVKCTQVAAALCQRTNAAVCDTEGFTEGACCNKDTCVILDQDIFADAKCVDYGACCPGAA